MVQAFLIERDGLIMAKLEEDKNEESEDIDPMGTSATKVLYLESGYKPSTSNSHVPP
jgi:hypothetical protein